VSLGMSLSHLAAACLLTATLAGLAAGSSDRTGACADGAARKVRFWVEWLPRHLEQNSTGCNASFLGNISKYLHAIDSLAPAAWTLSTNGSLPTVVSMPEMGGHPVDEHFWSCMEELHSLFSPNITLGAIGNLPQYCPGAAAAGNHPQELAASMARWLDKHPQVQEIWTDFEGYDVSHLNPNQTQGLFGLGYELLAKLRPTFVYGWGSHEEAMTCAKLQAMAPSVLIQDPDTYWDNTKGSGWYGGFEKLLAQDASECADALAKGLLSIGICPDCPTNGNNFDDITMDDLYDRMDAICHAGIKDISGFEFNEFVKRFDHSQDGDGGLGERYFEAFAYFRTGKKGLIRKLAQKKAVHAVSQQPSLARTTAVTTEQAGVAPPETTTCRDKGNRTLKASQCFDQMGNVCTASVSFNPAKESMTNCASIGFPCACCGNDKASECTGEGGRNGCICNTVEIAWAHIYARCDGCDQSNSMYV